MPCALCTAAGRSTTQIWMACGRGSGMRHRHRLFEKKEGHVRMPSSIGNSWPQFSFAYVGAHQDGRQPAGEKDSEITNIGFAELQGVPHMADYVTAGARRVHVKQQPRTLLRRADCRHPRLLGRHGEVKPMSGVLALLTAGLECTTQILHPRCEPAVKHKMPPRCAGSWTRWITRKAACWLNSTRTGVSPTKCSAKRSCTTSCSP